MHGWQILVEIPEVIFTELTRGIALGFECSGKGASLSRQSHVRAGLAHSRQTRA